jgi:hypothetical protein
MINLAVFCATTGIDRSDGIVFLSTGFYRTEALSQERFAQGQGAATTVSTPG